MLERPEVSAALSDLCALLCAEEVSGATSTFINRKSPTAEPRLFVRSSLRNPVDEPKLKQQRTSK